MLRLTSSLVVMAVTALVSPVLAMEAGQTYVTVQGGVTQQENHDFNNASGARVSTKMEQGYVVIGAVGRSYRNNVRAEVEGAYRYNDVDNHSTSGPALAGSKGQTHAASVMANGYYDMPTSANITPYVGGGLGVARVAYDNYETTADGEILDDAKTVPAFQAMAGINAPINKRLSMNAEYRYFTTAKAKVQSGLQEGNTSYNSHNITLGARYAF